MLGFATRQLEPGLSTHVVEFYFTDPQLERQPPPPLTCRSFVHAADVRAHIARSLFTSCTAAASMGIDESTIDESAPTWQLHCAPFPALSRGVRSGPVLFAPLKLSIGITETHSMHVFVKLLTGRTATIYPHPWW